MRLWDAVRMAAGAVEWAVTRRGQRRHAKEEQLRRQRNIEEGEQAAQMNQERYHESSRRPPYFAEERSRAERFTGIGFRGPAYDRRAWVPWAGMDVWELLEEYEALGRERLLEETEIPEKALDLALAYYEAYSEEIDQKIADNRKTEEEWRKRRPELFFPLS